MTNIITNNLKDNDKFYPLTNDVMFHAVFSNNIIALKGLICSVLHLDESYVTDIQLYKNDVMPNYMEGKEFRLDVVLTLNNKFRINLEMQIEDKGNWPNRSLAYLCRSYDHLNRGHNYLELQPAMHIGFLDFTLFDDHPKFHTTYKLRDIDDGYIYSDNFILKVVELNHTDIATSDDIKFGTTRWAKLFKATSREELLMIAQNNDYMNEAVNTAVLMNENEQVREAIILQEERKAAIRGLNMEIENLKKYYAEQKAAYDEQKAANAEQSKKLAEQDALINEKDAYIAKLLKQLADNNIEPEA